MPTILHAITSYRENGGSIFFQKDDKFLWDYVTSYHIRRPTAATVRTPYVTTNRQSLQPFLQNQGCLLLSPECVVNEGFLSRKQNIWLTANHRVQEFGVRNRKDSVIPHNLNSQSLLQDYSWVNKPRGECSSACMHALRCGM